MRRGILILLLSSATGLSCHNAVCPTIGCLPKISMEFANAIPDQYQLSIVVAGRTYQASCPSNGFSGRDGIDTCSSSGFELVGVDLGHADNGTLPLSVSIDGSSPIAAQAKLSGIQNSRDCDLVCYSHQGVVNN